MIEVSDYADLVARALEEDLDGGEDITSTAIVPANSLSEAMVVARAPGVVAGLEVARFVFQTIDSSVIFETLVADGDRVTSGVEVARVGGGSRSILTAERTALNVLGRMSGVATATRRVVDEVAGTGVRITDTRKTMPGMRALDKYAVRAGGGENHRVGLYDAVLIKDNHLVAAGGVVPAVTAARASVGPGIMIEVEVESLSQLADALETDADRILLDNMSPLMLAEAVTMVAGRKLTEASGGVTMENVREIAETGVDLISLGWITHSAPQLDLALDFSS